MKLRLSFNKTYLKLLLIASDVVINVDAGCTSNTGKCLGLLGAGTGLGSCAAPPFRATQVYYKYGCPEEKPCCSEYGYCRERKGCLVFHDFPKLYQVTQKHFLPIGNLGIFVIATASVTELNWMLQL